MARNVALIVMCEDSAHESFSASFLGKSSIPTRDTKFKRMGGRSTLISRFVDEVRTIRKRGDKCALLVVADADKDTPEAVRKMLSDELKKEKEQPLSKDDLVLVICPKYCIENWVYYLQGKETSEDKPCPKLKDYAEIRESGRKLAQACKNDEKLTNPPSSLVDACEKWKPFKQQCPSG